MIPKMVKRRIKSRTRPSNPHCIASDEIIFRLDRCTDTLSRVNDAPNRRVRSIHTTMPPKDVESKLSHSVPLEVFMHCLNASQPVCVWNQYLDFRTSLCRRRSSRSSLAKDHAAHRTEVSRLVLITQSRTRSVWQCAAVNLNVELFTVIFEN
eukprot:m.265771 g.265771  ORF g.265771 m.265771 type:complete len:152 (-) comp16033_c0_seq11:15-470(-)